MEQLIYLIIAYEIDEIQKPRLSLKHNIYGLYIMKSHIANIDAQRIDESTHKLVFSQLTVLH